MAGTPCAAAAASVGLPPGRARAKLPPRNGEPKVIPHIFRIMDTSAVTARTMQGMARVRSGQAPAWPLVSDRILSGPSSDLSPARALAPSARMPTALSLRACTISLGIGQIVADKAVEQPSLEARQ